MQSSECPLCSPPSVYMGNMSYRQTGKTNRNVTLKVQYVMSHDKVTLSMRELDGFFWKAAVASVLRARNSCTSSLLAASGMVHSFCRSRKGSLRENNSTVFHKSHSSSAQSFISENKFLTLRNDSSWLFLASTLSVSRLLKGRSGKSFLGPLTS